MPCFAIAPPPHSLGKLIEWKHPVFGGVTIIPDIAPHSLGKLIEWKLNFDKNIHQLKEASSPHSLGKLIEWKLNMNYSI